MLFAVIAILSDDDNDDERDMWLGRPTSVPKANHIDDDEFYGKIIFKR